MRESTPENPSSSHSPSLEERIYLQRARMFFGQALGNMVNAVIGGILISLVLKSADVDTASILIWFLILLSLALVVGIIEHSFSKIDMTTENAERWIIARGSAGLLVTSMFGLSPFLFSEYTQIHHEMFIFLILSAVVAVATTSFTVLPRYYLMINGTTMVPLTFYMAIRPDMIHFILAVTAVIWQVIVLSKAYKISQTTINAIRLSEINKDEIARHKETKTLLEKLATHDSLTGLPNRRLLTDHVDELIKQGTRYNRPFALMFMDLDGFKNINDLHGHDAGDLVLKEVARRLQNQFRESDTIARMGGDEFVLVYTDIQNRNQDVPLLVERILSSIAEPIQLPNDTTGKISASIGIALFPIHGETSDQLIKAADNAMYQVKEQGKNAYTYAASANGQQSLPF